MKKFIVLYLAPKAVLDDWAKTDPTKHKAAQEKMRGEWQNWMGEHSRMIKDTAACGKTKLVSPNGTSDTRNEMMMYSFVEAESHETAAKAFENHPRLQIPKASIRPLTKPADHPVALPAVILNSVAAVVSSKSKDPGYYALGQSELKRRCAYDNINDFKSHSGSTGRPTKVPHKEES